MLEMSWFVSRQPFLEEDKQDTRISFSEITCGGRKVANCLCLKCAICTCLFLNRPWSRKNIEKSLALIVSGPHKHPKIEFVGLNFEYQLSRLIGLLQPY